MNETDFLNSTDPIAILQQWVEDAKELYKGQTTHTMTNYNAMVVCSVNAQMQPSSRVVLAKDISQAGITFYTNFMSSKGQDFAKNPKVAANFYWGSWPRQIKIEGKVVKVHPEESEEYWKSRPRASQISQSISKQSQVVSEQNLIEMYTEFESEYGNKEIPRPPHWGGYLIVPESIEFWIGKENRLHDRFLFKKSENNWLAQRLFP